MYISCLRAMSALTLATLLVAGCIGTGEDRVTSIDAAGTVDGLVYYDGDGNREATDDDTPIALVGIRLLYFGTQDTATRALSDRNGLFSMPAVPAGLYRIVIDPATVPDSLLVVEIDPGVEIIASRNDTTTTAIALSFPIVTIEEARQLPPGERVFVEGVALNARETFGDQTVNIAGSTWAMRSTRVGTAVIFAGDSVRFLGTTSTVEGQPTLDNVTPFIITVAEVPPAIRVTTAMATAADSARLDAALVQVRDATISDTATVAEGLALEVNDGSGLLRILLDEDVPFVIDSTYVPGSLVDAEGLLVPLPGTPATWELKPRSPADIQVEAGAIPPTQ
ncbi:MAG: hypothetical protein AMS21_06555 [Gemmatimonas sp. SG8_38_2]|nr:MAG: hypothetical protein AMS21_06555 [Gemmatimonas sp. SG8_38_2]